MVKSKEIVFKPAKATRIRKGCESVAKVLACLSVLCVVDFTLFHHAHGMIPWWVGLGLSLAALLIILISKSSGLLFALPLAGFFLGVTLLQAAFVLLFLDLEGAINSGNIWLMKYRIREGADVNAIDSQGHTMLKIACNYWRVGDKGKEDFDRQQATICEMIRFLLNNGAAVNKLDDAAREAPLHIAARKKMYKVLELLLAQGANPNLQDRDGNTALHLAVLPPLYPYGENETIDIIELLIRGGANVNARNHKGKTPLGLIAMEEHDLYNRMAELLRNRGAKE